jgi:polar amino acid transport system substrate-binding protein
MNVRTIAAAALSLFLAACVTPEVAPSSVVRDLAPTGKLRAAINFGNPVLAQRDPSGSQPRGVSVDLSRELAKRLRVPVEFVAYDAAGRVTDDATKDVWDIAFVARDPQRAKDIEFTDAYVIIEGAYLVPASSPLHKNEDVDAPGVRIAVGRGSAYDLFLTRELKNATLVRVPTSPMVVDEFLKQNLEIAAGVKQQLEADAKRVGGVRLLPGRFMVINQAMGVPRGRTAAQAWLTGFVEEMKASGFVARALQEHGIEGAAVAPPGAARS